MEIKDSTKDSPLGESEIEEHMPYIYKDSRKLRLPMIVGGWCYLYGCSVASIRPDFDYAGKEYTKLTLEDDANTTYEVALTCAVVDRKIRKALAR